MIIPYISEKINTYETSILPYEDCCTIFVAKHPVTKPNLKVIKKHEENLRAMTKGIVIPGKEINLLEGDDEEEHQKSELDEI